jgi:predicted metalloprotease with PDZ domain
MPVLLAIALGCVRASATVRYSLRLADPVRQTLSVTVSIDHPVGGMLHLAIPAWTPGFYQILKFEEGIGDVHAVNAAGAPLTVVHPSPRVWDVPLGPGESAGHVDVTYTVRGGDAGLGFFGTSIKAADHQAYISGASAFVYQVGHTAEPASHNAVQWYQPMSFTLAWTCPRREMCNEPRHNCS